jgi:hypothetical protein
MEQVSGRIAWLELDRKPDWSRDGKVPVAVKAALETDDRRRVYVNTTCGYVQDVSGIELFMPTPGDGWMWAIPTGTDPRNPFVPTIWRDSRVTLHGTIRKTGVCKDGRPYVSLNRVVVDHVVLEPDETPRATVTEVPPARPRTPQVPPLGGGTRYVLPSFVTDPHKPKPAPPPAENGRFDWSSIMAAVKGGTA